MKKLAFILLLFFSFEAFAQEPNDILRSTYFGGGSYYIDQQQAESLFELLVDIPNASTERRPLAPH